MLDSLYENIGGKIKNWAKWMFIFEAIGAVIAGLVLLFTDEDLILYGLLTAICGPIVAYVSSWILYAFGQLVEDVERVRKNIVQDETSAQCHTNHASKKSTSDGKVLDSSASLYWTCSACKRENSVSREECWHCGQKQADN